MGPYWHADLDWRHPIFEKLRLYGLGQVWFSPLCLQFGLIDLISAIAEFDAYFWFYHIDREWNCILASNFELHHILITHLHITWFVCDIRHLLDTAYRLWILILSILFLRFVTDAKMISIRCIFWLQFVNCVSSFA